jgi:hypothetical protein
MKAKRADHPDLIVTLDRKEVRHLKIALDWLSLDDFIRLDKQYTLKISAPDAYAAVCDLRNCLDDHM